MSKRPTKQVIFMGIQLKARLREDKRIMLEMQSTHLPHVFCHRPGDDLWRIIVEYTCEDPRIIDIILQHTRRYCIDQSRGLYAEINFAQGCCIPALYSIGYEWLVPNYHGILELEYNASGVEAFEHILILPYLDEDGVEQGNESPDNVGITQMRRILYLELHKAITRGEL
jgi:hypothetical protein